MYFCSGGGAFLNLQGFNSSSFKPARIQHINETETFRIRDLANDLQRTKCEGETKPTQEETLGVHIGAGRK